MALHSIFWRIAMRPGKPLIFGRLPQHALHRASRQSGLGDGLCGSFHPARGRRHARMAYEPPIAKARLASGLKANGRRQDYVRARVTRQGGVLTAEPFALQDSSMQKIFRAGRRPDRAAPWMLPQRKRVMRSTC